MRLPVALAPCPHRLHFGSYPSNFSKPFPKAVLGAACRRLAHTADSIAVRENPRTSSVEPNQASLPHKRLPQPSPEQQVAIDTLLHTDSNIIIDAIAGSGKTTTILHLAQSSPDTNFLVLVYNRRLMLETEERVQGLGLHNVTVLNYHALGARYYTPECATDQGLKRVVEEDMSVIEGLSLPEFSVLVMDEQQDMTPILKRFVDKIILDKGFIGPGRVSYDRPNQLRVVVLGDKRQEVYSFNNADSRFLTMAARPEVFGYLNNNEWTAADQTTSNRVTQQNIDFINQQMLKQPLGMAMRAVRNHSQDGTPYPKPRYIICDPYEDILSEVLRLLDTCGLSPTEIIVLAPSVRGASPAIYLANHLALRGIPVFRSDSDVSDIAPGTKGIERRASIVLGFDQGYHTWFDKTVNPRTAVSNPQYVAATRALEHLVLIHDSRRAALPFVDLDKVGDTCELHTIRPLRVEPPTPRERIPAFSVTALCRNLSETLITDCLGRLDFRLLAAPAYGVPPPPTEIQDRSGLLEGVSSITGTAAPAVFQWRQRRQTSIISGPLKLLRPPKCQSRRRNPLRELPEALYQRLELAEAAYTGGVFTTADILYLANLEMAAKDKDITKLLAIPLDQYDWLSEAHCKDIHYTLNSLPAPAKISGRGIHFELIKYRKFLDITHGGGPTSPVKKQGVIVTGAMDICRPRGASKTVWEVKYTESLQPEHLLQTALYMLLLGEPASGFLVSARTGQTVQVLPRTQRSLREILQILVDAKSGGEQTRLLNAYSDEEFLAECGRDFEGLVGKCALPKWFAMRPSGSKFKKRRREKHG
ncbi:hypothetical protein INS49_010152 [Diaporthe citri]|uniref:uncharacterized protein n=1 Tax=Diaporthe citri TaxID=83186 RepID=UPI001C810B38|nr:uncharacterized protein INS49_010152 [Diaporthe citri]KAG6361923.1 hypothetical protein INS49_010152 [Diaporthe citri]